MVNTIKSNYIYQLDPQDHARVIGWWKNASEFSRYMSMVEFDDEIYYCYADDYKRVNGKRDSKSPWTTRDPRFCTSWHYDGPIHKYSPEGIYIEEMPMKEFIAMGGRNSLIGIFSPPYGYPELHHLSIMFKTSQLGYQWDFCKHDIIQTVSIPPLTIGIIGLERYQQMKTGQMKPFSEETKQKFADLAARKVTGRKRKNHDEVPAQEV
jgi:hypothetical protein